MQYVISSGIGMNVDTEKTADGSDIEVLLDPFKSGANEFQKSYIVRAEQDIANTDLSKPRLDDLEFTRLIRCKMMCVIKLSCVIMTCFAYVQSRQPMGTLSLESHPFFPLQSLVSDFYTGDASALTERLLESDLSLVLYYAPWDRNSQLVRNEIEKVARYYHEQIFFAAINCWLPQSECRSRYKIRSYPAIILHVRSTSGLETRAVAFNGPPEAPHIINFLSRCLRPYTHINSKVDVTRLQLENLAVVLGYYNFSSATNMPKGFSSFYMASVKSLQNENTKSLAWGVITNHRVALSMSFNHSQSICLVLWNTTLIFTNSNLADSEAISRWVLKHLDQPAAWMDLPETKSKVLSTALQEGPILLLFTPNNPFYEFSHPFSLLYEISLHYYNCENSGRVDQLATFLKDINRKSRSRIRQLKKACQNYLLEEFHNFQNDGPSNLKDDLCFNEKSLNLEKDGNLCDTDVPHLVNKKFGIKDCILSSFSGKGSSFLHEITSCFSVYKDSCKNMMQKSLWRTEPVCSQQNVSNVKPKTPVMLESHKLDRISEVSMDGYDDKVQELIRYSAKEQCRRLVHGSVLSPPVVLQKDDVEAPDINGLGCRTNKTLGFFAVDSLRHSAIAKRLGLNLAIPSSLNGGAVIVDTQQDIHFIMDAVLSKASLINFILNYTMGTLNRNVVSGQSDIVVVCKEGELCLHELTAADYLSVTQDKSQMVVVLHYTVTCIACTSASHIFLAVAHAARHLPNVTFARIDVSENMLPWHLNFPDLPTIIIHPLNRKSNSKIFDISRPLTAVNLFSFFIANLQPEQRLALALAKCNRDCKLQVLNESWAATTHLHHSLVTASLRLKKIMARLSSLPNSGDQPGIQNSEKKLSTILIPKKMFNMHSLLVHAKNLQGKIIRQHRISLNYISKVQDLMNSSISVSFDVEKVLKTFYHLQRASKESILYIHDEI